MPSSAFHLRRSLLVAVLSVLAACLALSAPAFAGDPATSIKINEVESEGLSDFIELTNTAATATDVSGLVLKDSDDTHALAIPSATSIPAGGFLAVDTDVAGGFGLDASDSARVFLPDGTTLIDTYTWSAHAATTYGRCPDGTGAFVTTDAPTKGSANACPPALTTQPFPGSQTVTTVDETGVLGGDVSGLDYEGSGTTKPGVLWAVDNGNNLLHRMLWDGTNWVDDPANGWPGGKNLRYPNGTGRPDAEGTTLTDAGAAGGVFVSSERDATANTVSRPGVLRYDVSGNGTTLTATNEWNLTPDLPPLDANQGAESVEWVPDSYLVSSGFVDQSTGAPYDPTDYPHHARGLFFVGIEANGYVYAYALDQTSGSYHRVATIYSGFPTFAGLNWDDATHQLWVACDNNCQGRGRVFQVDSGPGPSHGYFVPVADYARPTGMANLNNEGFTIAPISECVGGIRPVFWADDGNTDSHALRAGRINCSPPQPSAGWSAPTGVRGDFNGDGYGDLAVGAPGENDDAGVVHILYGSAFGVTSTGNQVLNQDTHGVTGSPEPGDSFGAALAAGDVNGDGIDDLAVGIPGEDLGSAVDAGAVQVLLGSGSGVSGTGGQFWNQGTTGIADNPEDGDRFGAALAAGSFTSSLHESLAIGAPGEDAGAGIVHVLPGGPAGLTASGSQKFSQSTAGVSDTAEPGDAFGAALAAGDVNGDPQDDLAVGVPGEDIGTASDAGAVNVLRGSSSGLIVTGQQLWTENSSGLSGSAAAGDEFGAALAVGNFSSGPRKDLAVGAPGKNAAAGRILVLPSAATGLTATGSQGLTQDTGAVADRAEPGDRFGAALTASNFDASAEDDLAIGVPDEDVGRVVDAGSVNVLPGSDAGLTTTGQSYWTQGDLGAAGGPETADGFGGGLGR